MGRADRSPARFSQGLPLREDAPDFGGFSALELDASGREFVALSDRGTLWRGTLIRDANEQITDIRFAGMTRLHGPRGRPLRGEAADSEGLAVGDDGTVLVSFERDVRIGAFVRDMAAELTLPRGPAFSTLTKNKELEALALAPDGALYTLPEDLPKAGTSLPVWRLRNGQWTEPFSISRAGGWKPVGADFGPDGRFYLLERDLRGLLGFAARVRVFEISGETIAGGQVVLQTPPGRHGNLEGLAVWRDRSGAIRLTMVADDNFSAFMRSEIVEYSINP